MTKNGDEVRGFNCCLLELSPCLIKFNVVLVLSKSNEYVRGVWSMNGQAEKHVEEEPG